MYATTIPFAGQKASVGRTILVRRTKGDESPIGPAIITAIRPGDIIDARSCEDHALLVCTRETFEAHTAETIDDMTAGAWAWPPRV
jgi:hypothetical protein